MEFILFYILSNMSNMKMKKLVSEKSEKEESLINQRNGEFLRWTRGTRSVNLFHVNGLTKEEIDVYGEILFVLKVKQEQLKGLTTRLDFYDFISSLLKKKGMKNIYARA